MIKSLVFLCLFVFAGSCSTNIPVMVENSISAENCYTNRKVRKTISNFDGEIILMMDTYVFSTPDKSIRYGMCPMPEALKKEGLKLSISGDVMEIFPNERRFATPFVLRRYSLK